VTGGRRLAAAFAGIALLGLTASVLPRPAAAADPFLIYAFAELTGSNAFVGAEEAKALTVAENAINASGGVLGRPIHFVISDDQTSPQVAVQIMSDAIAKHAAAVIGGGVVSTCSAAAGLVKADGPVLYCWSSGIHPAPGSYIFSSAFSSIDQMAAAVAYFRQRGWTKIAILTSTDATGQDADRSLDGVFALPANAGMSVVSRQHFGISDISLAAQMSAIQSSGAQALIAWTTGTPFGTVLHGMRDAGLDIPLTTTGGNLAYGQMEAYASVMSSQLYFPAIPILVPEGVTDPKVRSAVDQFLAAMKAAGIRPDIGYAVGWDGAQLFVAALRKYGFGATPEQIRDYIASQRDYSGAFGKFDFVTSPQRGLNIDGIIIGRWDAAKDRWIAVSKPGGTPLK
jgi:branched-chain amino acid transport system substrate-binding protein